MIYLKKFKLKCSWREYHSGELIVEAGEKQEAVQSLKADQNRLLELLIDKYANDTFESLSDIDLIAEKCKDDEELDLVIDSRE